MAAWTPRKVVLTRNRVQGPVTSDAAGEQWISPESTGGILAYSPLWTCLATCEVAVLYSVEHLAADAGRDIPSAYFALGCRQTRTQYAVGPRKGACVGVEGVLVTARAAARAQRLLIRAWLAGCTICAPGLIALTSPRALHTPLNGLIEISEQRVRNIRNVVSRRTTRKNQNLTPPLPVCP